MRIKYELENILERNITTLEKNLDLFRTDNSNFVIKIISLHWIDGKKYDGKDLCLHGKETTIPINQYKAVIFNYADKIKTFYSKSLPKEFSYEYNK